VNGKYGRGVAAKAAPPPVPRFTTRGADTIVTAMAVLDIARMGHPVLRTPAAPVPDPTAPEIARLIDDMVETMDHAGGLGLAAPQVGVPLRLVVYFVPAGRDPEAPDGSPLTVLVNPTVTPLTEETASAFEACLSLPGLTGLVPRATRVRLVATDPAGEAIDRVVTGFHARVIQHECDHLDGILYPGRMADLTTFGFVDEIRRAAAAADEAREPETAA